MQKVILPTPNANTILTPELARSAHTYDYSVANEATVKVDYPSGQQAAFEPAGFSRKVRFPPRASDGTLTLTDIDANANTSSVVLDAANRRLSATDSAGRMATMVYTADLKRLHAVGAPSDTYGAAPAACFGADRKAVSPPCASPPAHTATTYDTNALGTPAPGLAATYFPNLTFAGLPARHATVATTGGDALVPANPPADGLVAGAWSGRYTGEVNLASTGTYTFSLTVAGSARLYVDDAVVIDAPATTATFANSVTGLHRLRIDYAPPPSGALQLVLRWTPPGGSAQTVPASALGPRYMNVTRSVTDDNAGVPARTTASDAEAHTGLVKATTIDPDGLALTTTVGFEEVGDGRYRRPAFRTLPAGNPDDPNHPSSTAYGYYAGVTHPSGQTVPAEAAANPCVPGSPAVNQGAALRTTTGPPLNATTPGTVTSSVYDAAGRVVASWRNADPSTCTTYDPRGRVATVTIPGLSDSVFGATAAAGRTVTHSYGVAAPGAAANPLVTTVSDASGTITTKVDLLGRVTSTNDAWGDPAVPANSAVDHPTRLTYDQAGRMVTSDGPQGRLDTDYAGARVRYQHVGDAGDLSAGPVLAAPSYDAITGELTAVAYCSATQTTGACATAQPNGGNGTALTVGRDPNGRTTHLGWSGPTGAVVDDVVVRSQSGNVVDETVDGTDPNPPNPPNAGYNFAYDAAGRLREAYVTGHHLTWECQLHLAPPRWFEVAPPKGASH